MNEITTAVDAYSAASKVWLNTQISNINNAANQGTFSYDINCDPEIPYPIDELIKMCEGKRKVIDRRNKTGDVMPGVYYTIRIIVDENVSEMV